jgi:hypothetical protein
MRALSPICAPLCQFEATRPRPQHHQARCPIAPSPLIRDHLPRAQSAAEGARGLQVEAQGWVPRHESFPGGFPRHGIVLDGNITKNSKVH